jgi:TIR domain
MTKGTIFISHASEDKDLIVRPLAHALKARGVAVWYDEFSLRPGDGLRRSIDRGLSECKAGLVVLSPSFFSKEWPQRELDALFASEIAGRSQIIPIWHKVDFSDVAAVSPLLADRLALRSTSSVEDLARQIAELFPPPAKYSGEYLARKIELLFHPREFAGEAYLKGVQFRFLQMNAFKDECTQALDDAIKMLPDDWDELPEAVEQQLCEKQNELQDRFDLPSDVYLTTDEPISDGEWEWWLTSLCAWVSGTMSNDECANLVIELDLQEFDEYYVLLGIPNFSLSAKQRPMLEAVLRTLGSGLESDYEEAREICERLRKLLND